MPRSRQVVPLVLLALALSAPALVTTAEARAGTGFGYDDPRSQQLHDVNSVAALGGDRFLFNADRIPARIYRSRPGEPIELVAGGGENRIGEDPIKARGAFLLNVGDIEPIAGGGFLVLDPPRYAVDRVENGKIARVAGNGEYGSSGDGGPATSARLQQPIGMSLSPDGSYLLTGPSSFRIREVSAGGIISTVAGTGQFGITPDGETALGNPVGDPFDVAYTPDGGFVYSELSSRAIKKVEPDGTVATVAGGFGPGFSGDGGPAVAAELERPWGVDVADDGSILFIDGNRIRRIDTGGTIDTVAGTGEVTYNDDDIPAVEANLSPRAISAADGGGFLIVEQDGRIRRVSAAGTISTVAGMPAPDVCGRRRYSGSQGGSDDDEIRGGRLRDLIRGEVGNDTLSGRGERDCISGGLGEDSISGGSKSDGVDAESGDDRVGGGKGDDTIAGGGAGDRLDGAEGDDGLYGQMGSDRLIGGDGDDFLSGYTGTDRLSGGPGDDHIDAQLNEHEGAPPMRDRIDCGPGRDTVKANTADRIDRNCEVIKGAAGR
jgi:Ca2+-binding RTX toxin-like protein